MKAVKFTQIMYDDQIKTKTADKGSDSSME